jgi:hypothetical protein
MRRDAKSGQALVRHWQASGKTVAEYCRRARISRPVLDYWRRRERRDEVSEFIQIAGDRGTGTTLVPSGIEASILMEVTGTRLRLTFGPGVEAARIAQVGKMVSTC